MPAVPPNPEGELLLAVVGVEAVLERGPLRVTAAHRGEAARLPSAIRRHLRRFLTSPDFDTESAMERFDHKRVLELLTEPMDAEAVEDNLRGFDDADEALAFAAAAGRAVAYLQERLPRRSRQTAMGPKPSPPSDQDVSRFRRAWSAVERPLSVLEDLCEGVLSRDQVQALEAVYPALYEECKASLFRELAAVAAGRPTWELDHEKDKLLQVFLQASTWNASLKAALQKTFGEPEAEAAPAPRGQLAIDTDALKTPTDRIANR
jgi:hypothetical protein